MAVHEVTVWVIVDSDGNFVASDDSDHAADRYDETIGGSAVLARRVVQVTLMVPVEECVEMSGTAPLEGKPTLAVK